MTSPLIVSSYRERVFTFIKNHMVWSAIIVIALLYVGYRVFFPTVVAPTKYTLATVAKGTVVASIAGSGQVEASSSIDLKPKVSGTIVAVNVKAGEKVHKGQTLFAIDTVDARKAVRDAQINVQIAQNDLLNARTDYENTKKSQNLALDNLLVSLNSGVSAIADIQNTNTNIVTIVGSYNSLVQGRYTFETYTCQKGVCVNYSGLEEGSFAVNLNIPMAIGTRGLYATFTTAPRSGEKWYIDVPSPTNASYASNLKAYTEKQESVKEAIEAASQVVASRGLTLEQRQSALADAQDTLSNYYITAPFDGVMGTVTGKLGDVTATTLGTIITNEKLASISLNEVDVAKIKLGQKATLTFDAIDGLSIAGDVVSIDPVGTVTSGVVNYVVKIGMASSDDRIKPSMTVSAAIITGVAQDVLTIPASALKTKNTASYVEILENPVASTVADQYTSVTPTKQVTVGVGIVGSSSVEITSGLQEGDRVISKTITGSTTASTTKTPTATSILSGNRGAGR